MSAVDIVFAEIEREAEMTNNIEHKASGSVVTLKTEADIAADLKERYFQAMRAAADVMDEARRHGMLIQFGGIQADQFGRHFVPAVGVVKML